MVRSVAIMALALAASACAAEDPPSYVVRLDLDQIAAATAARDASPGFESLAPEAGEGRARPPSLN
jgi:hypothetical protein